MTEAELWDALNRATASTDEGEGFTVWELVDGSGSSAKVVRRTLKAGIRAGRVRVAKRRVEDISGRKQWVPSYVLTDEA